MNHILYVLVCLSIGFYACGQEDSLRTQDIQEIKIEALGKYEFNDDQYFITDFHVNESGTWLLMKRFNSYYMYLLDQSLELIASRELSFKAKGWFEDCMGNLHLLSKDSIYQVVVLEETPLIYDRQHIQVYHDFYENCVGSNSEALIYKLMTNIDQTTIYYQIGEAGQKKVELCRIEDSIIVSSVKEEQMLVRSQGAVSLHGTQINTGETGDKEGDGIAIRAFRQKMQRALFFETNVSKADYSPLFVANDTTYVFDFLRDKLMVFESNGELKRNLSISHLSKDKRRAQLTMDRFWESLYISIDYRDPNTIYELDEGFGLSSEYKLSETAIGVIEKVIIFNGDAYYMTKDDLNDNLNKLYKQEL